MDLKGRSFLTLLDYTPGEIDYLLISAAELKEKKKAGIPHRLCEGKNIALVFEKTSTRTRCAFEVAAADLGMHPVYLDPKASQIGKKESIADTARVFMGDARYNMANSLMVGCAKMGMEFVACAPEKYFPGAELTEKCRAVAAQTGAKLSFETDPAAAVKGADVIYTDVWVSMGEPEEVWAERIADLTPYRVTSAVMDAAGEQCRFMHCLPSYHDLGTENGLAVYEKFGIDCMEVTDEVFESARSIVFDEAENRMHTIKAVMAETL